MVSNFTCIFPYVTWTYTYIYIYLPELLGTTGTFVRIKKGRNLDFGKQSLPSHGHSYNGVKFINDYIFLRLLY